MRTALFLILLSIVLSGGRVEAARYALVIGNSAYEESPLRNPTNDSADIAAKLDRAGFEVISLSDATGNQMRSALAEISAKAHPEDSFFFFFAGHGCQVAGENLLLPVNFSFDEENEEKVLEAVTLSEVLEAIHNGGRGAELKIVVLDCCRNNPMEGLKIDDGRGTSVTIEQGLAAPAKTPRGTVLCFATDPGETAADGVEDNSPYTQALITHLFSQGIELSEGLRRSGQLVQELTDGRQNPWRNTNFNGEFYLTEIDPARWNTTMRLEVDHDNQVVVARFSTPQLGDFSPITGSADNAATEVVLRIPTITGKGIIGPSSDPSNADGFKNDQGTLYAFNLQPATKSSYPYLFLRGQDGRIHLLDNLPDLILAILPEKLESWRQSLKAFLRIERIVDDEVFLQIVDVSGPPYDSAIVRVRVDSRGGLTFQSFEEQ